MSLFVYNLFLACYSIAIRGAALFHPKARKWVQGRRNWRQNLSGALRTSEKKRLWVHCASLGEFEQGRPLIEAFKKNNPDCEIILTFFSPSGYEVRKNYGYADHVCYLPLDGRRSAEAFVDMVRPDLAVFVKYEFWYHYMNVLKQHEIPVILVSAVFRPTQAFFRWYGGLFRELLKKFSVIFVQDEYSATLLSDGKLHDRVIVAGDTRYDRVVEIADQAKDYPVLDLFRGQSKLLIAGSTWVGDEALLPAALAAMPEDWKLVVAPHEVDDVHIRRLQRLFGDTAVLYSALPEGNVSGKKVLIVNNIGLLSGLYRYGAIAYVGGGFQKGGIHNILEPAVFGLPVLFGPNYQKFVEAKRMVELGYAFPVHDMDSCRQILQSLVREEIRLKHLNTDIRSSLRQQTGARDIIMEYIRRYRWLS